ncbi:Nucleoporin nup107 [Yarrowia sp. C11]|nr:Nucleoporin nup107 [Yarrowia sp. E02]KAG5369271.1 Nucleoporin nup107 [Yarrowia sp. C11]
MEDEYQLFASALEAQMDNPLELIDQFMDISRDLAAQTAQETEEAMDSENFSNWELEARFWQLTATLSEARERFVESNNGDKMDVEGDDDTIDVYPFSSDSSVLQQYKQTHPLVMETFLVNRWLQDNLTPSENEQIEIWGSKWMHTKSDIASKKRLGGGQVGNTSTSTLVSEMDADAPLRQKKPIASEDAGYDSKFFHAIFDLIRRRQIKEASQLAEKTGNLSLKMAIGGLAAMEDTDVDPLDDAKAVGTTRTALWRRMCLSVAASPVGEYEKAVYGFLGGDVGTVLGVSKSWETQLLAYTNNMCSDQFEQALNEAHRVSSKTKSLIPLVCPGHVASMRDALELLSESSDIDVKRQALNPIRTFVGAVINNTIETIASTSSEALRVAASTGQPNPVSESAIILRVLVHLLLALRNGYGGQKKLDISHYNIISAYVERLAGEGHMDLVPLYLSFLDPEDIVNQYSYFLANISDPEERQEQIHLANQNGVDIKACVKAAVARVFDESMAQYVVPEIHAVKFDPHVDDTDVRLYRAVEWFEDVKMWSETIDASVKLLRRFLLCGKVGAAREAGTRLDVPMLMQQYQADTLGSDGHALDELTARELDQLYDLILFLDAIYSWEELMSHPRSLDNNTQIAHKVADIAKQSDKIIQGWLVDLLHQYTENQDIGPQDYTHLHHLRQIYIPYVILQLLSVYVRSRHVDANYVTDAIELSVLVADDQQQIYRDFEDSGRLEEFLQSIFQASALMT